MCKKKKSDLVAPVERVVIKLSGSATHCLDCGKLDIFHRMGCSCLDMDQPNALEKINIEHGFFKVPQDNKYSIDDFMSTKEIANHVKNNTADIYLEGKLVTPEMIE